MDSIEGESSNDGFPVLVPDFGPIDVEDNRKEGDERPVEVAQIARDDAVNSLFRRIAIVAKKHNSVSFLFSGYEIISIFWKVKVNRASF